MSSRSRHTAVLEPDLRPRSRSAQRPKWRRRNEPGVGAGPGLFRPVASRPDHDQAARGGRGAAGVDLPPHVSGDRDHGVSRRTGGRSSTRSGSPRTRRRSRRSSYDRMADTNAPRRSGSPTAASVAAIRGSALSERIRFRGVLQVGRGRVLAAEGECEGRIPRAETLSGPIRPDPPSRRVQCRSKRSAQWRRPGRRRRRRTRTSSSTSRSPRARRGLPRGHGTHISSFIMWMPPVFRG